VNFHKIRVLVGVAIPGKGRHLHFGSAHDQSQQDPLFHGIQTGIRQFVIKVIIVNLAVAVQSTHHSGPIADECFVLGGRP
jgi:hypothetical protein